MIQPGDRWVGVISEWLAVKDAAVVTGGNERKKKSRHISRRRQF